MHNSILDWMDQGDSTARPWGGCGSYHPSLDSLDSCVILLAIAFLDKFFSDCVWGTRGSCFITDGHALRDNLFGLLQSSAAVPFSACLATTTTYLPITINLPRLLELYTSYSYYSLLNWTENCLFRHAFFTFPLLEARPPFARYLLLFFPLFFLLSWHAISFLINPLPWTRVPILKPLDGRGCREPVIAVEVKRSVRINQLINAFSFGFSASSLSPLFYRFPLPFAIFIFLLLLARSVQFNPEMQVVFDFCPR